jgi:tetraacyldisaccharide 4'-kinase
MPREASWLESHWARRDAASTLLLPVAWLFAALTLLRRALYRSGIFATQRVPVPVIVVGNITVGGSGKTPAVIALVGALHDQGFSPGVVSRGYRGRYTDEGQGPRLVDSDDARRFGDEVVLMRQRLAGPHAPPIAVGTDRVAAARALLAAHPETNVLVCDDGLQHYALARDIELVVFDERGVGNGRLLPAGPLREPVSRARRADAVLQNGLAPSTAPQHWAPARQFAMQLSPGRAYQLVKPAHTRALAELPGPRRLAAAGIGNPARFFAMLAAHGVNAETLALADHFDYRTNPFLQRSADCILITEKDAVKCAHLGDARIWVVPVDAHLDDAFLPFLLGILRATPTTRSASA